MLCLLLPPGLDALSRSLSDIRMRCLLGRCIPTVVVLSLVSFSQASPLRAPELNLTATAHTQLSGSKLGKEYPIPGSALFLDLIPLTDEPRISSRIVQGVLNIVTTICNDHKRDKPLLEGGFDLFELGAHFEFQRLFPARPVLWGELLPVLKGLHLFYQGWRSRSQLSFYLTDPVDGLIRHGWMVSMPVKPSASSGGVGLPGSTSRRK